MYTEPHGMNECTTKENRIAIFEINKNTKKKKQRRSHRTTQPYIDSSGVFASVFYGSRIKTVAVSSYKTQDMDDGWLWVPMLLLQLLLLHY